PKTASSQLNVPCLLNAAASVKAFITCVVSVKEILLAAKFFNAAVLPPIDIIPSFSRAIDLFLNLSNSKPVFDATLLKEFNDASVLTVCSKKDLKDAITPPVAKETKRRIFLKRPTSCRKLPAAVLPLIFASAKE